MEMPFKPTRVLTKIVLSIRFLLSIILLLAIVDSSFGATYYSRVATGNFATLASWSTSSTGVPTNNTALAATDIFIIQNGHNITLAANQTVAGITINAGGTLSATTFILTVNGGSWTNNGAFADGTTAIVTFGGTSSINGAVSQNFQNVSIGSGCVLTINSATTSIAGDLSYVVPATSNSVTIGSNTLNVAGNVSMPLPTSNTRDCLLAVGAGTLNVTGSFTMLAAGTASRSNTLSMSTGTANIGSVTTSGIASRLTFTNSGVLNVSGTITITGTPNLTPSTGTVNFTSGSAQNIWIETYNNLGLSGNATKSLTGATTVSSVLTIASGSVLSTVANTLTLSGSGTPFVNNGTLTGTAAGTVTYSGIAATNIAGTTYNNLTFSGAGTKTFLGGSSTTVFGAFVMGSATVFIGSAGIDVNGAISGASALTMGSGTFLLGGANNHTGTFTAGTGNFHYDGTITQAVRIVNYYDLQFSLSGTKSIAAATTLVVANNWIVGSPTTMTTTAGANVAGDISGSGNITMGSGTIFLEGDWTNNGAFVFGTGTVHYDGTDQIVAPLTYFNLQTSIAGTKSLLGNVQVNNILTINSPSILDLGTYMVTLPLTGTPLVNNGTISGTGTVLYSGVGAQTITGTTYYNLQFFGAGAKTIAAGTTVTINNNWIVESPTTMTTTATANVIGNISGAGTLTMGSGTISLKGNWTKTGAFTAGTGTVNYDGTTQTIATIAYYNLQTSASGVKTLASSTTVSNVITINPLSTIGLSTFTLTLLGSGTPLVNNGIFISGTSTVNFSNAASTNIPALNYYNLNISGGPRVLANSGTIGVGAVFTPGAGGIAVTGSTVNFNGAAQTIPAFAFNDLILSGSGAKTILTATIVSVNAIDIQNGPTLDLPGTALINITKP